jgi:hypothetical protein
MAIFWRKIFKLSEKFEIEIRVQRGFPLPKSEHCERISSVSVFLYTHTTGIG